MEKLIYFKNHQKPELTGNELIQNKIEQSGYTMKFVGLMLGITEKQLKMRLEGKKEFYIREVIELKHLLNMSDREVDAAFF